MEKKSESSELKQQEIFSLRVLDIATTLYGENPKACVVTFGCQQNVSDSERLKGMLCKMGYSLTEEPSQADFVIFNTCAVREHAEDRVYGNIGALKKYKKQKPNMVIAICGCMVQQQHVADKLKKSYPYVDIVMGTQVEHRLPEFLYTRLTGSPRIFELALDNNEIIEGVPTKRDKKFKGWLPIMYGCNNFCTYCIVPYVRGRERSRAPEEILKEAREMVAAGYKDITLLGQNVNSYGKDSGHNVNFAKLLRMINDIEGDFVIRFMTSHPKDCTIELLETIKDCKKISRHLHLPFQSGSSKILKRMNRYYDREAYLKLIENVKQRIPDVSLTSDIIVGFPGETYEDFKETLSLVSQVKFSSLFTFIYSPRKGTPAAIMDDPVSREEKGRWFNELLITQEKIAKENVKSYLGKTFRVLCDGVDEKEGYLSGHTNGTATISFIGDENLIGQFVELKVISCENGLTGVLINQTERGI